MNRLALALAVCALALAGCGGKTAPDRSNQPPAPERFHELTHGGVISAIAPNPLPPLPRLEIPEASVWAHVQDLEVAEGGTLPAPTNYTDVGLWTGGPEPGLPGPAVIAGHLDGPDGPAVFSRLAALDPGSLIQYFDADGRLVTFEVLSVDRFAKQQFPTREVYGSTDERVLRLITCGGPFYGKEDEGAYRDNVVVYARLLYERPRELPTSR